ncbi:MAG: hypothetical protein A2792_00250 [Sphingomonadales bacterium RIFCSPHIGHO2_01_FULL_65_20]|nr:MAG: hypothetical protein A2792_00250 [Sphingomonadales bacterium RIFCSPHIGHO2_01_FULL_65_20]
MTAPLHSALRARLHAVLRDHFVLHPTVPLDPSTPLCARKEFGGLEGDSLDLVEIATLIEEEFEIGVDDDATADARTIGDLEDWLADNLRHCRACGCTENRACLTGGAPCGWSAPDKCTACTDYPKGVAA